MRGNANEERGYCGNLVYLEQVSLVPGYCRSSKKDQREQQVTGVLDGGMGREMVPLGAQAGI